MHLGDYLHRDISETELHGDADLNQDYVDDIFDDIVFEVWE